jgi:hypothetical protein
MRVDGRQDIEPDKGVELKPTASRAHGNVGAHHFVRKRTAVAIAAEGVNGPLPRRGEVELVVRRLPFHRDEGFEAGVVPELCSDARQAGRRDPDPRNISVEAEGHLEFSACRSAYEHLNRAHRLRACRRMAPEVYTVFDGHNGLGGRGGIALRPEYRVKLWSAQKPLSAPRFYCPNYRPFITISLTPLSVAVAATKNSESAEQPSDLSLGRPGSHRPAGWNS